MTSFRTPPAGAFPALRFPDWLELVEDRSAALRKAAGTADGQARVPGCPDWTVRDLVAHLGQVQRFWAAAVAAGRPPGRPTRTRTRWETRRLPVRRLPVS